MLSIQLEPCPHCGEQYREDLSHCTHCFMPRYDDGESLIDEIVPTKPIRTIKVTARITDVDVIETPLKATFSKPEKPQKGQSKQSSKKVLYDGYTFDSQLECKRYKALKLRLAMGLISGLEVHPKFILMPKIKGVVSAITYEADFSYWYSPTGFLGHPETKFVVEDIKATYSNTKKNIANKLAGKPIIKADARLRHKLVIAQLWGKYGAGAEFRIVTDVEG